MFSPRSFGAAANGEDDTAAVQACIDAASPVGGTVDINDDYTVTQDVTITADQVTLTGAGTLNLDGASLVIDGQADVVLRTVLRGLTLSRTGPPGAALRVLGGGAGTGAARWLLDGLHVSSSGGTGIEVAGGYLGTLSDCYVSGSSVGLNVEPDPVTGTIAANAVTWRGGEINACGQAATLSSAAGLRFFGATFERSTTAGVELVSNCRSVGFHGCYFEDNAGYDLKAGTSSPTGIGLYVGGACLFVDGTSAKDHAIELVRGYGIVIDGNYFGGYSDTPIVVSEASGGAVRGRAAHNGGAVGAMVSGSSKRFYVHESELVPSLTYSRAGETTAEAALRSAIATVGDADDNTTA